MNIHPVPRRASSAAMLAAAVVLAPAALADSHVTLYGVADAGIGSMRSEDEGPRGVQMMSSQLMNHDDSMLGVEGVQDLGAGLHVGFNFETALSLKNGAAESDFWEKKSVLWLGGAWGRLQMGRDDSPTEEGIEAWELTEDANFSVVNNTFGYVSGADGESTVNSQFSYTTPELAGFHATAGYTFQADNDGAARWDANLIYAAGPLSASVAANHTRHHQAGWAAGAKYEVAALTFAASWSDNQGLRRGVSAGANARFGDFDVTLDLTRDTRNRLGAKKYTNGLLSGNYALSKRTFVYAAYLRLDGRDNYGLGLQHSF